MLQDWVPARTDLASGIVIKQHLLERNKYPQPQTNINSTIAYGSSGSINNIPLIVQDILVSGTVAPQWNDYNEGTIENFDGGTGGSFERFNYVSNTSQSWYETVPSPLGFVTTLHDNQDEFYDGEFSGSMITVTTQSLNTPYPLDLTSLTYHSSGSTNITPSIGSFTWQVGDVNKLQPYLYVSSLYINEIDLNGNNIQTALSNLIAGNIITFTITGSLEDFPILPPTPVPYNITFNGLITSVNSISNGVWNIQLSNNISNAAVIGLVDPLTYVNYPSILSNSSLYLIPFINDISNFYNSDSNPLINNVLVDRLSDIYQDVDYSTGISTPTNFNLLISGSALKAAIQDSNYSSKRVILPRYDGSKSTSQHLNYWTPGDTGTYGKLPTIQSLKNYVTTHCLSL
jgi:hypothetical protein